MINERHLLLFAMIVSLVTYICVHLLFWQSSH
jgi:hypothetical protein